MRIRSASETPLNTPADSLLGQPVAYAGHYDASRLFPIARATQRGTLGITGTLPFHGGDIWNAYELSWLDRRGRPRVALARFDVPADSPNLIESKSLKLYLNGFMQTSMADAEAVAERLRADLSAAAGATVAVRLSTLAQFEDETIGRLAGDCIDEADTDIDHYGPPRAGELLADADAAAEETLVSHALKSNCPVTGQPDWASVQVSYAGPRIDRAALLRYLAGYREHSDFHEHCVERIFLDLSARCAPRRLLVYARYTRRGGLDINPWRSSQPQPAPDNRRSARQ